MGPRRTPLATALSVGSLLSIAAGGVSCGKVDASRRERPEQRTAQYTTDAEAVDLCREIKPCAPDQIYMCSIGGQRNAAASYRAPGVRIERLYCEYAKQGEDFVIGVPDDGSRHLMGLDLFRRVRGTPLERARAAAELVFEEGQLDESPECTPSEDEAGTLRFCVKSEPAFTKVRARCFARADGSVACSSHDPAPALVACQHDFGFAPVVAQEMYTTSESLGAVGMRSSPIASDHVVGGSSTGASVLPLRAKGMKVRQAQCTPTGAYPFRYAHWGEKEDGSLVFGTALFEHLETLPMKAALAADLALHPSEDATYLLLDPLGDADAMVKPGDRGCALPPGPREHDGVLELYTSRSARGGPEIRHCRVRMSTGRGLCGPVAPGTFC